MKIGVVADDLTGAGDAALAFARHGFPAETALWPPSRPPAGAVWVISTESRGLAPRAARARAARAARLLGRWKAAFIFKKIDSTMRGPVGAELEGLLGVLGSPAGGLPFVPAFPALARTSVGGRHFVDGVPLHRTAFARDPRHPARTDRLADLVGPRVAPMLWIPDVPDEAALRRAAAETVRRKVRAAAGSSGFAAALARELADGAGKRSPRPGSGAAKSRCFPILAVTGSAHPASKLQERRLRRWGKVRNITRGPLPRQAAPGEVFLVAAPDRRGRPGTVLRTLVDRAAALVRRLGLRRFAVTGGETSAALARALKVRRWRVVSEVERGVPLLASMGGLRRSWWVTKPGGFGREDVWTRAIKILARI